MKKFQTFDGVNLDFFEVGPDNFKSSIMVVSEIWEMTEFIKSFSDRLAKDGYRVMAPALYIRPSDKGIFTEENIMDAMRLLCAFHLRKGEILRQSFLSGQIYQIQTKRYLSL